MLGPDLRIRFRRARGANAEYECVEYEPPDWPRSFHNARVPQKRFEESPHRRGCRRIRCTEVDEKNTEGPGAPVLVLRRGLIRWHKPATGVERRNSKRKAVPVPASSVIILCPDWKYAARLEPWNYYRKIMKAGHHCGR